MAYHCLQDFISNLKASGELIEIANYTNPELEISEITDRFSKQTDGGKALLFRNNGSDFPVLINMFGSMKRVCLALNTASLDELTVEIEALMKDLTSPKQDLLSKLRVLPKLGQISSWLPKTIRGRGKCQEVVMSEPDLSKLPVLKSWPNDAGRFITLPIVNTKDPVTGIRNAGMYRMQIIDNKTTAMHWHRHKTGARHFAEYKKTGRKMPVAVSLGGDPALTYAASAPMPDNFDEYMLAGFLRKKKVELVKCLTQNVEVPADSDIVIEGYIDPEEEFFFEGPFGDHTGFYSLADWFPKFHVTCITHRKNAVYPATIVGIPPQEDAYLAKATERIFLAPIRMTIVPEMKDMILPDEGVAHNLAICKITKTYPGQGIKVANALWGAGQMMFNKVLIVVDEDINLADYKQVAKAINRNTTIDSLFFTQGPLDILDHASSVASFGGKICIDATKKLKEETMPTPDTHENVSLAEQDSVWKKEFPFVKNYTDFMKNSGISLLVLSVEKSQSFSIRHFVRSINDTTIFSDYKFILIVDQQIDIEDVSQIAWIALNNIDAKRDVYLNPHKAGKFKMIIDASRKTKNNDNFSRDWPNIVVSDNETIKRIDEIWKDLQLGNFLESPSKKYKKLVGNAGAIHEEQQKRKKF